MFAGLFQCGERRLRKKGNMVRYWADELAATKARGEDRTDLASIAAKTEA
jgi:hypothetical protein